MLPRLELYAVVLLGLILAAIAAGAYERHVGYQERANEDSGAALREKEASDKRLKDAQEVYNAEITRLSQPQPVTHVVCRSPSPVQTGSVQAPATPPSGVLPQSGSQDFDPGPALDALHDEADRIVAACRELDNSLPH